jgi:hypothetical protein
MRWARHYARSPRWSIAFIVLLQINGALAPPWLFARRSA